MKKLLVLIGLTIILSGCEKKTEETFCYSIPLATPTIYEDIEYQIINTIIETYYYPELNSVEIDQMTTLLLPDDIKYIREDIEQENIAYDTTSLLDYLERNKTNNFFNYSQIHSAVHLISNVEIDCLFSSGDDGWQKFYQKYPIYKGFFMFSRPGINTQKNKAIIEYSWVRNYLACEWYIVVLEKIDENWVVTHRILTAVT